MDQLNLPQSSKMVVYHLYSYINLYNKNFISLLQIVKSLQFNGLVWAFHRRNISNFGIFYISFILTFTYSENFVCRA